MNRYVITFGLGKPGICDGWVEAVAHSEDIARWWARDTYGDCWAGIYDADKFLHDNHNCNGLLYPLGCIGRETLYHDEVPT